MDKKVYIFGVDSYGTDSAGSARVTTERVQVMAEDDIFAIMLANSGVPGICNGDDISYVERPDGTRIQQYSANYEKFDFCNSRYCVGA